MSVINVPDISNKKGIHAYLITFVFEINNYKDNEGFHINDGCD
jgi:hypothetical protein